MPSRNIAPTNLLAHRLILDGGHLHLKSPCHLVGAMLFGPSGPHAVTSVMIAFRPDSSRTKSAGYTSKSSENNAD